MNNDLAVVRRKLTAENDTLVVCKGDMVFSSRERGIRPLLKLAENKDWSGACAADRIVGKAAAMLYVFLGFRAVYAEVLSESAKEVFERNGIHYEYGTLTQNIINRQGTGLCPMEETVKEIENPEEALSALRAKVREMSKEVNG